MSNRVVTAAAVLALLATAAMAQPLAERVPADAIVYLGWRGADELSEEYEGTHLQAVLEASSLPELIEEYLPRFSQRIAQENRNGAAAMDAAAMDATAPLAKALWERPWAFYLTGMDWEHRPQPVPRMALLIRAGDQAQPLAERLTALVQQLRDDQPDAPVEASREGELVWLSVGLTDAERDRLAQMAPADSLSAAEGFTQAMGQVHKSPVMAGYVDAEAVVKLIDTAILEHAPPGPQAAQWPMARDALGLDGLRRIAWSGGFEGKDWATHAYVGAPAPRKGLLALLDGEPVSDDLLRTVPATAALAGGGWLDLARVYAEFRDAAGKIDPRSQRQLDDAAEQIGGMLGFDVRADLLETLGAEWVSYTDRGVAGAGPLGTVVVNKLRDADRARQSLERLVQFANGAIASQMRDEDFSITMAQTQVGDLTIHYLAVPVVAPSWAIKDGYLYLGLYPQSVAAAATRDQGAKSILDNEAFVALRKKSGGRATGFYYADLPQGAGDGYQVLLLLSRSALGFADMFAGTTPAIVVPPLPAIRPHLAPAGWFTSVDEQGWRLRGRSPFPGSSAFTPQGGMTSMMSIQQNAMMIGILLPALGSARRTANQMKASTQARGLHQSAIIWANANEGNLPPDLATMYHEQYFKMDLLIAPQSGTRPPPDFNQWPQDRQTQWINENASFVLIPGLRDDADSEKVAVFQKPADSDGRVIAVVFNDNHAVAMPIEEARELIEEQTGKSLEELAADQAGEEAPDEVRTPEIDVDVQPGGVPDLDAARVPGIDIDVEVQERPAR